MFGFGSVEERKEERIEFNRASISWYSMEKIIKEAVKLENGVAFPLAKGVTLEVKQSLRDNGTDYGSVNVFGFIINVTFPIGKRGHFLSFPQYARKGGFSYYALCVDKNFHDIVKELIALVYEEGTGEETEETSN